MAKEIKRRRGTTVDHSTFTGAVGEITVDTDKNVVVVHDGGTQGGFPLALESAALSDAEIKTAYENNADTNEFSDAEQSKLAGIETSATADQSDAEIKTAYENNANTNEFSDAEQSKLSGIETSADVTDDANVRAALAAATADVSVNSHKITSVTDPTADQDAATKAYVDSIANGLETKGSVRVATTANITLSGTQTIDGVTAAVDDRVLVKDQTNKTENGIYDVAAGAWSRSGDADNTPGGELGPGSFTFVEEGTTQADNGYVATGIATGTGVLAGYFVLGVDNIEFSQFSGAGQITAGTNLNKNGNTINLDTTLTNFASTGIDDNATSIAMTINSSENIGIGITSPDGKLHVHTGSAGAVTANTNANDFVIENSATGFGISLLGPTNAVHRIVFGNPTSAARGGLLYLGPTHTSGEQFRIDVNEATRLSITSAGKVGIGTTLPDGTLHVHTASAGAVTASTSADDGVFENSADGGISILVPDASDASIFLGSTSDNDAAVIQWQHNANLMTVGTNKSSVDLRLMAGLFSEKIRIKSSGKVGIGTTSPDGKLHVHTGSAGAVTAVSGVDDIVIEGSGGAGLTILTPNNALGQIVFGDSDSASRGLIRYTHSLDFLSFGAGGNSNQVVINSSGEMGIGTTSPDGTLHVRTASAGAVTAATTVDDLVIENSTSVGITFLSPNNVKAGIAFGDPQDNNVARIEYDHATDSMQFRVGGGNNRLFIDSSGAAYISDNSNANMTIGLTINQAANSNQAFALKSTNVDTNLTTATLQNVENDDFFTISKSVGSNGGVLIQALAEDVTTFAPFIMHSIGGQAGVTASTTSIGLFNFFAAEHNNANSLTNIVSTSNLLSIQAQQSGAAKTAFLLKANGELHLGNTTIAGLSDDKDDVMLLRAYDYMKADQGAEGLIRSKWDDFVHYNYDDLVEAGIISHVTPEEREEGVEGMWNMTQHIQLLNGAIWQMHTRQKEMEVELNETRDALTQTTAALAQNTMILDQAMKQLALLEGPNNG